MTKIRVIYRNDGQGNIRILPIAETDMPQDNPDLDHDGWSTFYRKATAQYGLPDDLQDGAFLASATVHIYQSVDNIWAVFGLDVRPGLDDHAIRLVRFAYRDAISGTIWSARAGPPMSMRPDIARSCVAGWTELGAMPTF